MDWAATQWKEGLPTSALTKINNMEEQIERCQKQGQQKQFQIEQMEQALNKQKQRVEEELIDKLRAQKEISDDKVNQLEVKLKHSSQELECQRHNSEAAKSAIEEKFKNKESAFKVELKQLQQNIAEGEKHISDLKIKLQRANSKIQTMDSIRMQLENSKTLLSDKEKDANNLQGMVDDLLTKKCKLEEQLTEIRKTLAKNEEVKQLVQSKLDSSDSKLKTSVEEGKTITREMAEKDLKLFNSSKILSEKEASLELVKNQNCTLEQKLSAQEETFKGIIQKLSKSKTELEARLSENQSILDKTDEMYKSLQAKVESSQENAKKNEAESSEFRRIVAEKDEKLVKSSKALTGIEAQLDSMKTENDALKETLKIQEEKHSEVLDDLVKTKTNLEEQLNKSNSCLTELEEVKKSLEVKLESSEASKSSKNDLEDQLKNTKSEAAVLQQLVQTLEAKVNSNEDIIKSPFAENNNLKEQLVDKEQKLLINMNDLSENEDELTVIRKENSELKQKNTEEKEKNKKFEEIKAKMETYDAELDNTVQQLNVLSQLVETDIIRNSANAEISFDKSEFEDSEKSFTQNEFPFREHTLINRSAEILTLFTSMAEKYKCSLNLKDNHLKEISELTRHISELQAEIENHKHSMNKQLEDIETELDCTRCSLVEKTNYINIVDQVLAKLRNTVPFVQLDTPIIPDVDNFNDTVAFLSYVVEELEERNCKIDCLQSLVDGLKSNISSEEEEETVDDALDSILKQMTYHKSLLIKANNDLLNRKETVQITDFKQPTMIEKVASNNAISSEDKEISMTDVEFESSIDTSSTPYSPEDDERNQNLLCEINDFIENIQRLKEFPNSKTKLQEQSELLLRITNESQSLNEELEKSQLEVQKLSENLYKITQENSDTLAETESLKNEIGMFQSLISSLLSEHGSSFDGRSLLECSQEVAKLFSCAMRDLKEKKTVVKHLSETIEEIEGNLEIDFEERTKLKELVETLEGKLMEYDSEKNVRDVKIHELETKILEKEEACNDLKNQISELSETKLNEDISLLNKEVEFESAIECLEFKNRELEEKLVYLAEAKATILELKMQVEYLEAKVNSNNVDKLSFEDIANKLDKAESQLQKTQATIHGLQAEKAKWAESEEHLKALQTEYKSNLDITKLSLEESLRKTEDEVNLYEVKLTKLTTEMYNKENELRSVKKQLEKTQLELDQEVEISKARLMEVEKLRIDFQKALDEHQTEIVAVNSEMTEARELFTVVKEKDCEIVRFRELMEFTEAAYKEISSDLSKATEQQDIQRQKIELKEAQIVKHLETIKNLEDDLEKSAVEVVKLNQSLHAVGGYDNQIVELERKIELYRVEIQSLKEDNANLSEKSSKLEQENKNDHQKLEKTVHELQLSIQVKEEELVAILLKLEESEIIVNQKNKDLAECQSQFNQAQREAELAKLANKDLESKIFNHEADITEKTVHSQCLEQNVEELQQTLNQLNADKENIMTSFKEKVTELNKMRLELEKDKNALKGQVHLANKMLRKKEKEQIELQNEYEQLQEKLKLMAMEKTEKEKLTHFVESVQVNSEDRRRKLPEIPKDQMTIVKKIKEDTKEDRKEDCEVIQPRRSPRLRTKANYAGPPAYQLCKSSKSPIFSSNISTSNVSQSETSFQTAPQLNKPTIKPPSSYSVKENKPIKSPQKPSIQKQASESSLITSPMKTVFQTASNTAATKEVDRKNLFPPIHSNVHGTLGTKKSQMLPNEDCKVS